MKRGRLGLYSRQAAMREAGGDIEMSIRGKQEERGKEVDEMQIYRDCQAVVAAEGSGCGAGKAVIVDRTGGANESWDSEVRKGLQHVVARKMHPRGYITLQLEECRKCVDITILCSLHPGMDRF
jgi:hypothetical protein